MTIHRPTTSPFDGGGLFFKPAAVSVLAGGMFLHAMRLIAGEDVLTRILTPAVDGFFGLAMAYAALAGSLSWRHVQHGTNRHKAIHAAVLVYLTASVPVHVRSFATDDVTDILAVFPPWYSGIFLIIATAMLVHVWRLRIARPVDMPATGAGKATP